jgi:hypothetical protein
MLSVDYDFQVLLPNAETQIDARSYDDQKGEVVRYDLRSCV